MKNGTRNTTSVQSRATVLMLLTNAYDPDPRVRQEALALIRMGCRVKVLAWDRDVKSVASECMEGVEVERLFLASQHGRGSTQIFFYALLYLRMLWRGLRTRFNAVHCHDLDTLPIGFLLGKLKRTPIVYDAHESFVDMLEGCVPRAVQRGLTLLENFLIRRIDLLVTVGEKLRRHFAERGATRSIVVGNWKRMEDYSRTPGQNLAVRNRLGIPEGALTIACITQLLPDRTLDVLLPAIDQTPDTYLLLGGKGQLEEWVRERAARNPRIVYIGFVSGRDIPDYTCAADVVYYGFDPHNPNARFSAPNKLFEALAAGRPLITGDFGEIADVVREASCGVVLPEYNAPAIQAAIETLREPGIRSRMAANALEFGRTSANADTGAAILHREYSKLLNRPVAAPLPAVSAIDNTKQA